MNGHDNWIQIENLKKYYPSKSGMTYAVDDVSFTIHKGEVLGLVGESGCGKTTIGKQIVGLEKPTAGKIRYQNREITGTRNRSIQMIFQDPYSTLNPRKHIYEILSAPMLYHGISNKATIKQDLKELLNMVGLSDHVLERYPHEFSGGQRQRIGIARALSLKPDFVICDEPVSALDVSVQAQILNLLRELQKELSLTMLFIGHGLGAVYYVSDRIAVMKQGKVVEIGEAGEVFSNPQHAYTKLLLDSMLEI